MENPPSVSLSHLAAARLHALDLALARQHHLPRPISLARAPYARLTSPILNSSTRTMDYSSPFYAHAELPDANPLYSPYAPHLSAPTLDVQVKPRKLKAPRVIRACEL